MKLTVLFSKVLSRAITSKNATLVLYSSMYLHIAVIVFDVLLEEPEFGLFIH